MANSQNFTVNIKALFDASDVKNKVRDIQGTFNNLKLSDKLKTNLQHSFDGLEKALNDFESRTTKGIKTKADASGLTRSMDNVIKEFNNLENIINKVKQEVGTDIDLSKIKLNDNTVQQLKELEQRIITIKQEISSINTNKLSELQNLLKNIKGEKTTFKASEAIELFKAGDIEKAIELIDQLISKQKALENSASNKTGTITANIETLTGIREQMINAAQEVQSKTNEIGKLTQQQADIAKNAFNGTVQSINQASSSLNNYGNQVKQADSSVRQFISDQVQFNQETEQLKSRIQYFFGLNNAINLVKRTMRSAVETIKSLDKAMTATAVVTDFTVSDMWSQLPEYTKRANELGVSTQAAYEAATLYYQQGLKTNQVIAISNETLKMARIAGLDAADATDRMTNALRGFNMEINQTSAERVNDVYSKLAAISASNVDEISTAMTKVASLAHNAGMEFETTAAFLAQIIETTRESAETAGTALKTVVARFSEVKKLVSADQIKGQDEEGQLIDVNKVSAALRTAGIDLNKYFIGEVGLDDIFMELASKWDSLSTLQQRYIATQAAGSRQQSRFIALMSDYARTQELVGEAYNANGAAAKQFAKTQDSLESKLARLKNAWDQFAMGILNSDVVKIGVDLLTGLLNIINSLTSGFGTLTEGVGGFISSLLKLSTLIGGLGLGKKLFGSLLTKALSSSVTESIAETITDEAGKTITKTITKKVAGEGVQKGLGSGLFAGAGKGAWAGAKNIGNYMWGAGNKGMASLLPKSARVFGEGAALEGGAGLAAGFAGIGTVLAGMAALVAAGYGIYQLWLNFTTKGRLQKAIKEAENLRKDAEESESKLKSLESFQDTYKEKTTEVDNATTLEDRQKAIQERNEAIQSALKEDQTLAQYVITEVVDNEIVLTLDEDALANAAAEAAKIAAEAAVNSYFGEARVNQREIEDIEKRVAREYRTSTYTFNIEGNFETVDEQIAALKEVYQSRGFYNNLTNLIELEQQLNQARGNKNINVTSAYTTALKQQTTNTDLINSLLPILVKAYDQSNKQLADEKLVDVLNSINSDVLPILDAYNKTGEIRNQQFNFNLDDEQTFSEFLETIGVTTEALADLEEIIPGITKIILSQIKNNAKQIQDFNKQNVKKLYTNLIKSGSSVSKETQDKISALTPQQVQQINTITEKGQELNLEIDIEALLDADSLDEIQSLLDSISLDNPISAYAKLQKVQQSSNEKVKEFVKLIEDSNKELFSTSGLFKSLMLSEGYDELSESLQKLIKKNGKITSDNIDELAESNEELNTLIEENKMSTTALARALTLIENGDIGFEQITESIIKALSVGESFEEFLDRTHKFIQDFDKGTDLTEGTEFLVSMVDEAMKDVENWRFGNQPLENIYDMIYGKGAFKAAYDELTKDGFDAKKLEEFYTQQFNNIKKWAENEGIGALDFLIDKDVSWLSKENGNITWDLSGFKTTGEAVAKVAEELGVSEEAARLYIEGWTSHLYELREAWNDLHYKEQLNAFVEGAKKTNGVVETTNSELEAMGALVDKSGEEVQKELEDLGFTIKIQPEFVDEKGNPLTGEALYKDFEKRFDFDAQYAYRSGKIDADKLINNLIKEGYSETQAKDLANSIAKESGAQLTRTIQRPNVEYNKTGAVEVTYEPVEISADTIEGLEDEAVQTMVEVEGIISNISDVLTDISFGELTEELANAIQIGATQGANLMQQLLNKQKFTAYVKLIAEEPEKEEAYVTAQNLIGEGKIAEAKELLSGLIEEDADSLTGYKNAVKLDSQSSTYLKAQEAYDKEDYETAKSLFASLGDFADSAERLQDVTGILVAQYEKEATKAEEEGRWADAAEAWAKAAEQTQNNDYYLGKSRNVQGKADNLSQTRDETIAEYTDFFTKALKTIYGDENISEKASEALKQSLSLEDQKRIFEEAAKINPDLFEGFNFDTFLTAIENLNTELGKEPLDLTIDSSGLSQQVHDALAGQTYQITLQADLQISTGIGFLLPTQLKSSGAAGGIVPSHASGTHKLKPGIALTGEEAPEIVWNKEKGYAYITGAHGPQFQNLRPGDQVFNAQDTKKILENSGKEQLFGSYAIGIGEAFHNVVNAVTGAWKNNSGSGSGGGSSKKSSDEWKNELDWLYDLMEDIAEEEHKQTLIQSEYELATKDLAKTGRDLFNLTKSELETLQTQLSAQQFAFEKRLQQMNELQQKVNAEGFQDYLQWNPEDSTLEIDWDKINEITDKDTYDKLSELVSDMEKVQDQIDDAQKTQLDIKKQIQELQMRYLQAYLDFQDRVMEAVVAQYQQNIDDFSTLNDTINEASQSILDSIQKEIDLQRQIRDNTKTEEEIADLETRIAFLLRDSTGSNEQELQELQKQLKEARESYSDTLVDQAIDRLSKNNDDASSQREKQIELLQAQLEYWQETGALWQEVADLIASGFTSEGSIIEGSALWEFLKNKDSWNGLSQAQKENWANELILTTNEVGAYLIQLNDGAEVSADRIVDSIIGEHGLAGEIKAETEIVRAQLNELIAQIGGTPIDSIPGEGGYASGGLNTKTGYAMLHGTANEPEYVLNARQTDAFLRLADVLPTVFSSEGTTNSIGGNVYVDLTMNVGEIGSDYDVDRMVARVKEDIYSAATYRNVNAVSFLR